MILAAPSAPAGSVLSLPSYRPSDFPPGSAVLCRNKAPLVSHCYALLQRDVPCTILGKDIGKDLTTLVKKLRAFNLTDLQSKLEIWRSRESAKAEADGRSPEPINDQAACISFLAGSLDEDSQQVSDLIAKIELMFTDDTGGSGSRVTLSTIHKAKGLEFPLVFLLDRDLLPSKYARLPWQRVQERNLLYVAVTRAKETLCYISSSCWKE